MISVPLTQVNIIAIGVENYQFMKPLRGPKKDVESFVELISDSQETRLYDPSQIKAIINPNLNSLRKCINDFVIERSAQDDILIFYFSGHGIPVGPSDFGFCPIDARIHDTTNAVLPLTVLRFRDLIHSLRVMSITPVIIIDACFSGIVGSAMSISSFDAIENMHQEVAKQNASNYALLCSCSDRQVSIGNNNGGVFSQILFNTLSDGSITHKSNETLYLQNIFPEVKKRIHSEIPDSTPQIFLSETIPLIPLVKNVHFEQKSYRFSRYLAKIIHSLWNDGKEQEWSNDEILHNIGKGAYANHRKLSFPGWDLLEDNPLNSKRRLTAKGKLFAQGKLHIPYEVVFDPAINDYIAASKAKQITINDYIEI